MKEEGMPSRHTKQVKLFMKATSEKSGKARSYVDYQHLMDNEGNANTSEEQWKKLSQDEHGMVTKSTDRWYIEIYK